MKLLYILGSYYPAQSGGPNNTIHWQAKYLSREGIDVCVASLKTGLSQNNINNYNIELNSKNKIEGVNVYYFNYLINRYLSFKFYFWLFTNVKRFDFVQLTSYFFPITWFGAFLCSMNRVPFSVAPRGELEENAIKYRKKLKLTLHKIALKIIYKRAKFILVTSHQELEFSKKFFKKDMIFELIPNYIEIPKYKSLNKKDILNKKNILYLGRLHPKKGIENLIKAYFSLDQSIANTHFLIIAGEGSFKYTNLLKKLVKTGKYKENIIFLGHKEGVEKEEIYKQSKVFVLPSYSENFGNVVLESLTFSTPVIASKKTPWAELETKNCGLWVDNNYKTIRKGLESILRMSDSDYLEISLNAYQFVKREFNVSLQIHRVIHIYKKHI